MSRFSIVQGNCLDTLKSLPDNSVDSVVTDPPYGLSFMGKKWDYDVPSTEIWAECLRVLKPGGHLLAFAGTRTQHRMAVRIEDAGFHIRDMIMWVYGSGFPKSQDVSKAIDKAAGAEREVVGVRQLTGYGKANVANGQQQRFTTEFAETSKVPATDAAKQWEGWGTALKPSCEPITVARKPLIGTVAANVLQHGTGAINIDGCRVGGAFVSAGGSNFDAWRGGEGREDRPPTHKQNQSQVQSGRWPANLIHDGSDEIADMLTQERARFFYSPKANKADRGKDNPHPTVKPTDLMRYLCRLVTPPGGLVLDPFCGSGSTGKAALLEGFEFLGCELDPAYVEIANRRLTCMA